MASYIPVSGTFAVFGTRFVSPALGFTLGMLGHSNRRCPANPALQGGTTGCNGATVLSLAAVAVTYVGNSPPCRSLSIRAFTRLSSPHIV